MRTLITGGYGFVGRHLATHLCTCGDDVAVCYYPQKKQERPTNKKEVTEQAHASRQDTSEHYESSIPLPKSVQSLALDITDTKSVNDLVALLRPDVVYHLAALTYVPDADKNIQEAFQVNAGGTINMLSAITHHSPKTRFLYVSTSEVYGEPWPGSLPLTEQAMLRPVNMYGITKVAADLAAFKFAYHENIYAVRVRPFPHIGPGQNPVFAISSFAKQLAEIKLGQRAPVVKVGNLDPKRDFTDVADTVRGYREAILNGKRGDVYNLCSGQSFRVGDVLQKLIQISGVSVEVQVDSSRVRAADVMDIYGSYQKANKDFGWKPRIELDATLHSLFAYWAETLDSKQPS